MNAPAELRSKSPGTVTEAKGVDRDHLPVEHDCSSVTPGLVQVRTGEIVRLGDRSECELDMDPARRPITFEYIRITVSEFVAAQGFQAPIGDSVSQLDVRQRLVGD